MVVDRDGLRVFLDGVVKFCVFFLGYGIGMEFRCVIIYVSMQQCDYDEVQLVIKSSC